MMFTGFLDRRLIDLRQAARRLWKAPGFTAAAVLTLALGIGVNVAIFTLTKAVLLTPLPVRQPLQIVSLGDAVLNYYAALFTGREEQATGRQVEACAAYSRASALFPLAQSPLLALSHLARDTGDRAGALRAAQRVLDLPADADDRVDPLWTYHYFEGRHATVLLERLYRPFRGGESR